MIDKCPECGVDLVTRYTTPIRIERITGIVHTKIRCLEVQLAAANAVIEKLLEAIGDTDLQKQVACNYRLPNYDGPIDPLDPIASWSEAVLEAARAQKAAAGTCAGSSKVVEHAPENTLHGEHSPQRDAGSTPARHFNHIAATGNPCQNK